MTWLKRKLGQTVVVVGQLNGVWKQYASGSSHYIHREKPFRVFAEM
jgi:hypothetical protein